MGRKKQKKGNSLHVDAQKLRIVFSTNQYCPLTYSPKYQYIVTRIAPFLELDQLLSLYQYIMNINHLSNEIIE